MSEGAATEIDPRFDPRFQRGYSGQGARQTDAPAAPAAAWRDASEPGPTGEAVVAGARVSARHEPQPKAESATHPGPEASATAVVGDWFDDGAPVEESRSDVYFVAAWLVSAVAVVVGAGLFWSGMSSTSFYGPPHESDRLIQTLSWMISPALVQAGCVGLIVMLVWTGIRHAAARAEADE